jgi:hypothetical protein
MRRVILESPYQGNVEVNVAYARSCMRDCLMRGEVPIASHLLYTQKGVLDDNDPRERELGIAAGLAWGLVASAFVFYTDLGWSPGMCNALDFAKREGVSFEFRSIMIADTAGSDERPAEVSVRGSAALRSGPTNSGEADG